MQAIRLKSWIIMVATMLVSVFNAKGITMQTQKLAKEMHIVGITTRTSFQEEADPKTSKLGPCIQRYWQEHIAARILHRAHPGVTYALYTEYDSDFTGTYTYLIGEEVSDHNTIPEGLRCITIPAGTYVKFTTDQGPIVQVVLNVWQSIWQMQPKDLGGARAYQVDFERYDERAQNPQNAIADIFVGIQPE